MLSSRAPVDSEENTPKLWASLLLQTRQPNQRMLTRIAAHLHRRLQPATESWALGLAEHLAAQIPIQLHTRHSGGFAIRHARKRGSDGGGDAAGGAGGAAVRGFHGVMISAKWRLRKMFCSSARKAILRKSLRRSPNGRCCEHIIQHQSQTFFRLPPTK